MFVETLYLIEGVTERVFDSVESAKRYRRTKKLKGTKIVPTRMGHSPEGGARSYPALKEDQEVLAKATSEIFLSTRMYQVSSWIRRSVCTYIAQFARSDNTMTRYCVIGLSKQGATVKILTVEHTIKVL